tara:strand:+ start:95 stop:1117 length:1023 start_codon:yes stop_codon:yes gene_type:complete
MRKRLTKDIFIKRCKEKHDNKYDYSLVDYVNTKTKVEIICKKHGKFLQIPEIHLRGGGCQKCAHIKVGRARSIKKNPSIQKERTRVYISKANKIHNNLYSYGKVTQVPSELTKEKILITCRKHGDFYQLPASHIRGAGCPKCAILQRAELKRNHNFIGDAIAVHGDAYDYSEVEYINNITEVKIICPKHGAFRQRPTLHISKRNGCPKCIYKGEGRISEYLQKKHIIYREYSIKRKRYDFMIPKLNLIIERDGQQHYGDKGWSKSIGLSALEYTKQQQANDKLKTKLANEAGFMVARIPYWLTKKEEQIEIENILAGKPTYPDVPDLKQDKTKPRPKSNL